jgi:PKD repeat protein
MLNHHGVVRGGTAVLAGTIALVFAMPGAALASTYCVSAPGCSGVSKPSLQSALDDAAATSDVDTIQVGAGIQTGSGPAYGFDYTPSTPNDVVVQGAGQAQTTLTAASPTIFHAGAGAVTMRDLTVRFSGSDGRTGVFGVSLLARVDVIGTGAIHAIGVKLPPGSGSYEQGTVSLQHSTSAYAIQGEIPGGTRGGTWKLSDLSLSGDYGVFAPIGADMTLVRSHIHASLGFWSQGGSAKLQDDSITIGEGSSYTSAILADAAHGADTVDARNLTLRGDRGGIQFGVQAAATNNGDANVTLRDSVLTGMSVPVRAVTNGTSSVHVVGSYNAHDPTADERTSTNTGTASIALTNDLGPVTGFVSADDPRPRFDSPLVDRGTPGGLASDESTNDLDGLPRIVNARRDVGAFEYARRPPSLAASTSAASVSAGDEIAFSSTASDPDPGDGVTVRWMFGDGGSASGAAPRHSYPQPGNYEWSATAVDSTGLTASVHGTVAVTARPALATAPPSEPPNRSLPTTVPLASNASAAPLQVQMQVRGPRVDAAGRLTVDVKCPASAVGACRGRLVAQSPKGATLAKASVDARPGKTQHVRLRLSRAARSALRRHGRLRIDLAMELRDDDGASSSTASRLAVRAR